MEAFSFNANDMPKEIVITAGEYRKLAAESADSTAVMLQVKGSDAPVALVLTDAESVEITSAFFTVILASDALSFIEVDSNNIYLSLPNSTDEDITVVYQYGNLGM